MLGLIIWGILIFWIACSVCPGFFIMCCITIPIAGLLYYFLWWLFEGKKERRKKRCKKKKNNDSPSIPYYSKSDIEAAKDEWEKKWGRQHPTRIDTLNKPQPK